MGSKSKILERIEIIEKCKTDFGFRKEVLQKCEVDSLYWFDNFAWTLDPRKKPSEIPLIPYEGKQREFIRFLDDLIKNPRDVFIDKPRDVGATVLTTNWILKQWLFSDSFNARLGSRKEDYVDKAGDPDTLMYKLDFSLQRLPTWMKPTNWSANKDRSHMRLSRPDNSNTIAGESANPSFARGGRQTVVLYDEIGFWPWAKPAWESGGDVTNCRIAMTTPPESGKNSHAWKLQSGQAGDIEVFGFDFSDIPWKNADWLKSQRKRRSNDEFEREVNKSYVGTLEGTVYASEWDLRVYEGDEIDYDPELPLFVSWDFGVSDPTAMIWFQKDMKNGKVYIIDSYTNSEKPIDFYVPFVTGNIISGVHNYTQEDLQKIKLHRDWRKDITHFGDPDVNTRDRNLSTTNLELQKHGIYVQTKSWAPNKGFEQMKEKTMLLLRRLEVNSVRNEYMIECIKSAKYPKRAESSQSTTSVNKPIHDWTSHFRTALEYFADNEPKSIKKKKFKPIKKSYKPKGGY